MTSCPCYIGITTAYGDEFFRLCKRCGDMPVELRLSGHPLRLQNPGYLPDRAACRSCSALSLNGYSKHFYYTCECCDMWVHMICLWEDMYNKSAPLPRPNPCAKKTLVDFYSLLLDDDFFPDTDTDTDAAADDSCQACGRFVFSFSAPCLKNEYHSVVRFCLTCAQMPAEIEHPCDIKQHLLHLELNRSDQLELDCTSCGGSLASGNGLGYVCRECRLGIHLACHLADTQNSDPSCNNKTLLGFAKAMGWYSFDEADELYASCGACGHYIISGPYISMAGGNMLHITAMHKECAEMPFEIRHHRVDPKHSLRLRFISGDSSSYYHDDVTCVVCLKTPTDVAGLYYGCWVCGLWIHFKCLKEDREHSLIEHSTHPDHPLALLHRPVKLNCHGCGAFENEVSSYACVTCGYWIGKTCARSLPMTVHFHPHAHHLSLVYSLFQFRCKKDFLVCQLCRGVVNPSCWSYWCAECSYIVHVKCGGECEHLHIRIGNGEFDDHLQFPLTSDNVDIVGLLLEKMGCKQGDWQAQIDHWTHSEHPLILINSTKNVDEILNDGNVCSACIRPLTRPFYGCTKCSYFLHRSCSILPTMLRNPPSHEDHLGHHLILRAPPKFSLTFCYGCKMTSNGLIYQCNRCSFSLDITCSLLPKRILHEGHQCTGHTLVHSGRVMDDRKCNSCGINVSYGYKCRFCDFTIDYGCALWPRDLKLKMDVHPLLLKSDISKDCPLNSNREVEDKEDYCGFCEKRIDFKKWIYYSQDCDQSLHTRCIPETDAFSKLNYGGIINHPRHDHPLKFIRKSKAKYQAGWCSFCGVRCMGWPSFECKGQCDLIVCFSCWLMEGWAHFIYYSYSNYWHYDPTFDFWAHLK